MATAANAMQDAERALKLMGEALAILDRTGMPMDIGAHLDLAMDRLRRHLEAEGLTLDDHPDTGSSDNEMPLQRH